MRAETRVLLHDFGGYPFTIQLARELAKRKLTVRYLYYSNLTGPRGSMALTPKDPPSLFVNPITTKRPFSRYRYRQRILQEIEYGLKVARVMGSYRQDVVISANTPPISQCLITLTARAKRCRSLVWVQDIFSIATGSILAVRIGILGSLAAKVIGGLERATLRNSEQIVSISPAFSRYLIESGINEESIETIQNWAPLEELAYFEQKPGSWAAGHGLPNAFRFLYSGALGDKHDPDSLLGLAEHFRADPHIQIVVVSEGKGADYLVSQKMQRKLSNLFVFPYQPFEYVPVMMADCDVLLATLTVEAAAYSVPSKILSYLTAGRPILALLDPSNLAARLVSKSGAGIVIPPDDYSGFLAVADSLSKDAAKRRVMGAKGRAFAERTFDIRTIADRFEQLIGQ